MTEASVQSFSKLDSFKIMNYDNKFKLSYEMIFFFFFEKVKSIFILKIRFQLVSFDNS